MQGPLVIGIDLGTSNCALSWARAEAGAAVVDFPIHQRQRAGLEGALPLLPSCLYHPAEGELPGGETPAWLAGEFARWQGARVPGRLVSSAKSWLCHAGVDRSAAILPWGGVAGVPKLSPVEASSALLTHLAKAWDAAHPEAPLAAQELVITVPASFDEVARTLTVEAARRAGLSRFHLVEEPQAAFHDFVWQQGAALGGALEGVRLVLVVDVGGGTTDLTLVEVGPAAQRGEAPALRRIAVGEHLMLGGDNMDATLARLAEERLAGASGRRLSPVQWAQLVQVCRAAKESLLGEGAPERHGLAIAGEGSRLLGNTLSCELTRDEVRALVLDGFFPRVGPDEFPRRQARSGLQELGLPYAQEAAITRHIAGFLARHASAAGLAPGTGLPRPDAVLLNGGAFNSPLLAGRLLEVLASWWPGRPGPRLLPHSSLDQAVARGAVAHGLARLGLASRISGGAPHALYVGLGAGPGSRAPQALCVIARGDEPGCVHELRSPALELLVNRPVSFPLLASTGDASDSPGALVTLDDSLAAVSPLSTVIRAEGAGAAVRVPVHLRATLTELGTLELHCVPAAGGQGAWLLEFDLRAATPPAEASHTPSSELPDTPGARLLLTAFGPAPRPLSPKELRQLPRSLEDLHGPRDEWDLAFLRSHWALLHAHAAARRRSPDHERAFFQLLGFFLRPGFGDGLDAWRCEQTFRLFDEGVRHTAEPAVWNEFWVLFRRIAGGLPEALQLRLWEHLRPHLARRAPLRPPKHLPRPKGVQPEGTEEMVRLAASLEHLGVEDKTLLATWLLERLDVSGPVAGPWAWALGRLGARVPLYGSAHRVVSAEAATAWLEVLLARSLVQEGAPFAAAQLARVSGDRARDLDPALRERLALALTSASVSDKWIQMVREHVVLDAADSARALGDRLPLGLRLAVAV